MSKIYTVELEVNIKAESAQEAFETLAYHIQVRGDVSNVEGICEPYCVEGDDE